MDIRQAITTKFIGPTNHRGSRIVARAAAGRLTLNWEYGLNIEDNHAAAARALAERFQWTGTWYGGGLPSEDGYVFVNAGDARPDRIGDAAFYVVQTLENSAA